MTWVRWPNLICGLVAGLFALISLAMLLASIGRYGEETEDAWLAGMWLGFLGPISALCLWNAARSADAAGLGWRTVANLLAVCALAAIMIIGQRDLAVLLIAAPFSLGPLTGLFAQLIRS